MMNVYILTKANTIKNYVKSFNTQSGYMAFTLKKQEAANVTPEDADKLKALLDRNKLAATIEAA